ncbi:hypothetical protein LR48_Vigan10g176200 [Vigna angularis]|uniref:Uncharacterized protein n=1 Tax=Phaseolus angularis TaxID=3914 RepID=A0A0L9VLF0_PHAAN|nr:hypothetical protein LR48_Vigan10g176200 [Vigna angularis]
MASLVWQVGGRSEAETYASVLLRTEFVGSFRHRFRGNRVSNIYQRLEVTSAGRFMLRFGAGPKPSLHRTSRRVGPSVQSKASSATPIIIGIVVGRARERSSLVPPQIATWSSSSATRKSSSPTSSTVSHARKHTRSAWFFDGARKSTRSRKLSHVEDIDVEQGFMSFGKLAEQLVDIIARILAMVRPWTHVYRVQRDIPMPLVTSGVEKGNLRELALAQMEDLGLKCRDVRTREVGIQVIVQS